MTINKEDQNFSLWLHEVAEDLNWTRHVSGAWELLTCIILDTRTPLERLRKVVLALKDDNLLDFRNLRAVGRSHGVRALANTLKNRGYPWYNQKARYFLQTLPGEKIAKGHGMYNLFLYDKSFEEMQEILGVGPKLAALWMRIVHGDETHPVIDTHVYRWALAHGYKGPALGSTRGYQSVSDFMFAKAKELGENITVLDQRIVAEGIARRKGMIL